MCIRDRLYTARQKDSVLTLDVPAGSATFRTTVQDMQTLLNEGVSTLVVQTEKGSTTPVSYTHLPPSEREALAKSETFPLRQRLPL